jgi:hypothetical protein
MFTKNKAVGDMLRKLGNFKKSYDYGDILLVYTAYTGCVSQLGDFATVFFPGSATLEQIPLPPFCCQL